MSKRYKIILAVRFTGYLVFFIGLTLLFFMLGPLIKAEVSYRTDKILGVKRTVISTTQPTWEESPSAALAQKDSTSKPTSQVSGEGPVNFSGVEAIGNNIIPVSTEYGIVIEKINANAKIIPNINPGNERAYVAALVSGVAEAAGSTPPGQPGNLYLFSHSTDAPWNIVRFNAVFYLLRELVPGDRVIIFYQNKRYDYIVYDKIVVSPSDVSYLTRQYDYPALTLQTCDPPGTLLHRLIVRAKLVNS